MTEDIVFSWVRITCFMFINFLGVPLVFKINYNDHIITKMQQNGGERSNLCISREWGIFSAFFLRNLFIHRFWPLEAPGKTISHYKYVKFHKLNMLFYSRNTSYIDRNEDPSLIPIQNWLASFFPRGSSWGKLIALFWKIRQKSINACILTAQI